MKVVQELVRHGSSKITMDVYAQARMEDKRRAQLRIVKGLRNPVDEKKGLEEVEPASSLNVAKAASSM